MAGKQLKSFTRAHVARIPFEITNLERAAHFVLDAAASKHATSFRLVNAYCVAVAEGDKDYLSLLRGPGYNFPDGTPVAWAMRRHAPPGIQPQRVRGPSLFASVLEMGQRENTTHFFLGTAEPTLSAMCAELRVRYPNLKIAGTYAPPFGPLDDEFYQAAISKIQTKRPDIVWVALGSPKQDFASLELARRTGLPCIGVGAAFDFAAGTASEAPKWVQDSGVEWLFRFATEPQRLWRRYVFGNLKFARSVLVHWKYKP